MIEEDTKDLNDYVGAFRRRRTSILGIAGALFAISLLAALLWPPTYQSKATILIEEQEVPSDMIRSTITSFATQRIEVISQRVMSRSNLMDVIEKYKLYPDKRGRETTEEIHERMRKDINVGMITANVMDPRSGRPMAATIAFSVSYEGENAETTQKVASELTSLYLSENLRNRTEKAAETTTFLSAEAKKLGQDITELETKLASFKKTNADRLPELSNFNMQSVDRIEREVMDADRDMNMLEERKIYLESQLALINPQGSMFSDSGEKVLDPESRLKMLRSNYLSVSSMYSPDHPDVVRLKREIEGLEKQTGSVNPSGEQAKELSRLRNELSAAREKYSEDHPDVIRLTKSVAALEDSLKKRPVAPETSVAKEKPENPAYIMLSAQLETAKSDMVALRSKRIELKDKLASYQKRLAQTPEVERAYLDLKRDYDNSVGRYHEIKAKEMQAEIGQQLEKERKGERFSLLDPPQFPEKPIRPNRPAIIMLGFILSIAGGLGYALAADGIDSSVRSARSVTALLSAPPLSVIPYMKNNEDLLRAEKTKRIVIITFVSSFVLVVLLVHLLWTPLDVLWFKGLRKVDNAIGN